jgi:peptidoglycan/xylan/chitin deacetylase (PgdA/CDA1 family)
MRGVALGGAVCAASALLAYAVRGRSSTLLAPSVYRGSRHRRAIALTFDDGPSEGTNQLLDILNRFDIPATFFVCGMNVSRLPGVVRAAVAARHEIGNHSYSHPALYLRSQAFINEELSAAQSIIAETTGAAPAFFRAPFGARWFGLREAQRQLNLLGVMWTVLGLDWKLPADRIARRILSRTENGGIICLHDGRGVGRNPDISQTLEAVEILIPALKARGFVFETVSQLLCPTH